MPNISERVESCSRELSIIMPPPNQWNKVEGGLAFGNKTKLGTCPGVAVGIARQHISTGMSYKA